MVSGRLRPPPLDATDINDFQELVAGASRRASTIVTPKREPPEGQAITADTLLTDQ